MAESPPKTRASSLQGGLPFYYGWVVVAVAFVTMGIGTNARTSFSLFFPAILDEFGWSRGETAAAFSLGFLASAVFSPALGWAMDRFGPRWVVSFGALAVSSGLALATLTTQPWHLYLTLGCLVVGGSVVFSYSGHSMFLPHWFVRRRGLALGISFSGVGVGSIVLFPWMQHVIGSAGWRQACLWLAALLLLTVLPLNLVFQRRRPQDLGLLPDGDAPAVGGAEPGELQPAEGRREALAPAAGGDWTLRRALRSAPFWWLAGGYFLALTSWYMVVVHQTKYLIDIGIEPEAAALALGLVGFTGIVGQIGLGHLSDRIGREWAWGAASCGFAACYAVLMVMGAHPSPWLMYLMVALQGGLGYGLASVYGAIPAEIFGGRSFGLIFGVVNVFGVTGAGFGPWAAGLVQDAVGSYWPAFAFAIAASLFSILCIWQAAPRKGSRR